jgi:hypothetical protein
MQETRNKRSDDGRLTSLRVKRFIDKLGVTTKGGLDFMFHRKLPSGLVVRGFIDRWVASRQILVLSDEKDKEILGYRLCESATQEYLLMKIMEVMLDDTTPKSRSK